MKEVYKIINIVTFSNQHRQDGCIPSNNPMPSGLMLCLGGGKTLSTCTFSSQPSGCYAMGKCTLQDSNL